MVDIVDSFKDKIEKKKAEKMDFIKIEDSMESVDATIEEPTQTSVIQLGKKEESTPSNVIQLGKKNDDIALVAPVNVPQPNTKMINLTKKDYATDAPVVIQNTGSFSQDDNIKQAPVVEVDVKTAEPSPWFNKEFVAKCILGVTFTSIVVDAIMGVYNVGPNGLLLLIAVSAIIQFLLVAEYRKPTLH